MNYNYHTHTARCGHASDAERDYIEAAIAAGIQHMGFSDHMPFLFPDGRESESDYRIPVMLAEDYFKTLYALREEYKDKIELHIGFEMEYYPNCFGEMLAYARKLGAEYLILGQHFLDEREDVSVRPSKLTESEENLKTYTDCVVAAMESGVFTYVAHPDLCRFVGADSIYYRETARLLDTARETKTPLEINFLGIRDGRHYPMEKFWKLAGKFRVPVTFGFDAHDAAAAADLTSLPRAMELVEKYNLNYIGEPELKKI
ncbi:MAG: PHP domain-containing protein [Ruminococcaceae bacterium]|nr:PHP domain-containing protein [Oscillospiraceae bacterium]